MTEKILLCRIPAGGDMEARIMREGLSAEEAEEALAADKDLVMDRLLAYQALPEDSRLPVLSLEEKRSGPLSWTIEVRTGDLPPADSLLLEEENAHAAVSCIRDAARALAGYAGPDHFHGCLSPGNLFLTGRGLWVPGLPMEEETEEAALRRLAFSAPDPRPGRRSDVCSLGLALHYLLNRGMLPFSGEERDKRRELHYRISRENRLQGTPLPPPMLADADLTAIIRRAAAPDPADRYAGCADLARALDRWLDSHPLPEEEAPEEGIFTEGGKSYRVLDEKERRRLLPTGLFFILAGALVFFYNIIFGILLMGIGIRRLVIRFRGRVRWYGENGLVGRLIYRLGGIDQTPKRR